MSRKRKRESSSSSSEIDGKEEDESDDSFRRSGWINGLAGDFWVRRFRAAVSKPKRALKENGCDFKADDDSLKSAEADPAKENRFFIVRTYKSSGSARSSSSEKQNSSASVSRIPSWQRSHCANGATKTVQLALPEFLQEQVWDRHDLSMSDIHYMLRAFAKRYAWQLVVLENLPVLNSANKTAARSRLAIIPGCPAPAAARLIAKYSLKPRKSESRLLVPTSTFSSSGEEDIITIDPKVYRGMIPKFAQKKIMLPFHYIDANQAALLSQVLDDRKDSQQTRFGQRVQSYATCFQWRSICFVPIERLTMPSCLLTCYLVVGVMPEELFARVSGRNGTVIATAWDRLVVRDTVCAILDESFYLVVLPSSS